MTNGTGASGIGTLVRNGIGGIENGTFVRNETGARGIEGNRKECCEHETWLKGSKSVREAFMFGGEGCR